MELEIFIEWLKDPAGRDELAIKMTEATKLIELKKTKDCIRYLSLPLLLLLDDKVDNHDMEKL